MNVGDNLVADIWGAQRVGIHAEDNVAPDRVPGRTAAVGDVVTD